MSQVDLTFLTPGSVWVRPNQKQSIVLFVSNLTLKRSFQEQNPPQVVYLNEAGDVLTMTIASFLASRTFYNVVPKIEALADQLMAFQKEPVEDEAVEEVEAVAESEPELVIVEDSTDVQEEQADVPETEPEFVDFTVHADPELKDVASTLSSAVFTYTQVPLITEGYVDHIIEFDKQQLADVGITPEGLAALFDPTISQGKEIPAFSVNGGQPIVWTAYIGVFARMSRRTTLVCLHLATENNQPEEQTEDLADKVEQAIIEEDTEESAAPAPAAAPQVIEVSN